MKSGGTWNNIYNRLPGHRGSPPCRFLSSKAVKFDPIKVKEGDSFAVQSLGQEKVGCQQNHRGRCRLEATKPVVFLPSNSLEALDQRSLELNFLKCLILQQSEGQ